jgi:hypothetical protein
MVSGIVYFDEIIENIKDVTGIDNMRPLYSRIRRFCYNCEIDIGAGGVVVLKKKEYQVGDGFYDGKTLRLPNDFVSEWTYGSLTNGVVQGNVFKLYNVGPDKIDFKYLGFLLDEEGNPFTTRNRLPAIVAYSVYRLYSSKYFIGTGNRNQYMGYQIEYEDAVLMARGNDAFPSEEDWNALGAIRLGGTFEAMTDCGMKMICFGTEDPSTKDTTLPDPIPVCVELMMGVIYGTSLVTGRLKFYSLLQLQGESNGSATLIGQLRNATLADFAIYGVSNGMATVTGLLLPNTPIVQCNENFSYSGNSGTFQFTLELGSGIGMTGIKCTPYSVPDRFRIEYNGVEVANSKFIGSSNYEQQLLDLGYDPSELDLTTGGSVVQVPVLFYKPNTSPSFATIYVEAPISGTAWAISGVCPTSGSLGTATVTGTLIDKNGSVSTVIGILTDAIDTGGIATVQGILTVYIEPLGGFASTSGTLTAA